MQSGSCLDFGTRSACMLLHLLCFGASHGSSPILGCDLGPLSFGHWHHCFSTLFGVMLAPERTPSQAVWLLPCLWHAFCLYAAPSAVFCCFICLPHTMLRFRPALSASGAFAFRPFLASFWPLNSRPAMQFGFCRDFGTRAACMLPHLLFFGASHACPQCNAAI